MVCHQSQPFPQRLRAVLIVRILPSSAYRLRSEMDTASVYPSSSLRASSASSSLTRASAANLACCSASLASLSCSKVGISRPVRGSRQRSSTALPPHQQTQRGAVALQDSVLDLLDGDWLVLAVHKPVPGQPAPVEAAGLVEPPIFRDAQRRVSGRFVFNIVLAGSLRGYLHYQVRRLALPGYDVAVVLPV